MPATSSSLISSSTISWKSPSVSAEPLLRPKEDTASSRTLKLPDVPLMAAVMEGVLKVTFLSLVTLTSNQTSPTSTLITRDVTALFVKKPFISTRWTILTFESTLTRMTPPSTNLTWARPRFVTILSELNIGCGVFLSLPHVPFVLISTAPLKEVISPIFTTFFAGAATEFDAGRANTTARNKTSIRARNLLMVCLL